jgi:hypothetical protein
MLHRIFQRLVFVFGPPCFIVESTLFLGENGLTFLLLELRLQRHGFLTVSFQVQLAVPARRLIVETGLDETAGSLLRRRLPRSTRHILTLNWCGGCCRGCSGCGSGRRCCDGGAWPFDAHPQGRYISDILCSFWCGCHGGGRPTSILQVDWLGRGAVVRLTDEYSYPYLVFLPRYYEFD